MKIVFHRDRTIASTMGHTIHYAKGEPTHTPPEMLKEVLAAGGEPADSADEERAREIEAGQVDAEGNAEPGDPSERADLIRVAIEDMVRENAREDFTAGGQPHLTALKKRLGWSATAAERDAVWTDMMNINKD